MPLVEAIENNLGRKPEQASADSGYCSEPNLKALVARGIDGYVAPGRAQHPTAANGKVPKVTPAGLPKGDRADAKAFRVSGRQAAAGGKGGVLKLSPLLFTINEPGSALTSLVNGTPTTFRS